MSYADLVSIHAGETLFRDKDPADAVFILLAGQLAVKCCSEVAGNNQLVALLAPPAPVGESALTGRPQHHTTVTAIIDSLVVRMTTVGMAAITQEYPQTAIALLRHLLTVCSQRLAKCSSRLAHVL